MPRLTINIPVERKEEITQWLIINVSPECAETFTNPLYDALGNISSYVCSWYVDDIVSDKLTKFLGAPKEIAVKEIGEVEVPIGKEIPIGKDTPIISDIKATPIEATIYKDKTFAVVKEDIGLIDEILLKEVIEEKPIDIKPVVDEPIKGK
jgi:hypothetical protein